MQSWSVCGTFRWSSCTRSRVTPFKVQNNEKMQRMIESTRKVGAITPALARLLPDGGYELISGHRRLAACQVLVVETMPVIVRELSDDEAVIAMVDANLQRETILPSEKAFAYKMKRDALNHQGMTSPQVGEKLLTAEKIGLDGGDSRNQVLRYIRLTYLIPELLSMVDDGKIAFNPALGLPEKGNKRKAEAELARLRAEFEPPKEVCDLSSDMLFADYLLEWLEIAKGRLAVVTYCSYTAMIKNPIASYFRKKKLTLRELEARHLQMVYSELLKKVKPNTVIHYHAIIHSALKYAVKTDMLLQNVADKVDRPKKNDFKPVFLSAEEIQKMFEALRGTRLELPVLVAAFYGFRRGEIVGLKWDAIDFECGTITIRHTVPSLQVDGKTKMYAQDSAKTKSSMCTLPLVDSFAEYFKEVKAAQEVNKKVCGNCYNYEYDGYVFVDELGDLMRPEYLTSYFPQYIQKHGCKRMRFHNLRHSCASFLPQTASAPSLFESLFLFCQSKKQALRPAFHSGGELGIFSVHFRAPSRRFAP